MKDNSPVSVDVFANLYFNYTNDLGLITSRCFATLMEELRIFRAREFIQNCYFGIVEQSEEQLDFNLSYKLYKILCSSDNYSDIVKILFRAIDTQKTCEITESQYISFGQLLYPEKSMEELRSSFGKIANNKTLLTHYRDVMKELAGINVAYDENPHTISYSPRSILSSCCLLL